MQADSVDKLLIQWTEARPDLEPDSLGIVVRILHLSKLLTDDANDALLKQELALWEYDVLSALCRQGKPFALLASELAAQSRLSTGAMTHRINRLEARGFVKRVAVANDRRAVQIQLSQKGLVVTARAIETRIQSAEKSLQGLSAADRQALAELLRRLLIRDN